ncbi:hypothetical protein TcWFU_006328 [Taenia crassiceps]|uniref:Uncharacterized protein n=1 Tax=Taenia crassiceps TaxID=6207 RepID=A0ABR4QL88_9CEST
MRSSPFNVRSFTSADTDSFVTDRFPLLNNGRLYPNESNGSGPDLASTAPTAINRRSKWYYGGPAADLRVSSK